VPTSANEATGLYSKPVDVKTNAEQATQQAFKDVEKPSSDQITSSFDSVSAEALHDRNPRILMGVAWCRQRQRQEASYSLKLPVWTAPVKPTKKADHF
jgi:hypothetical protein